MKKSFFAYLRFWAKRYLLRTKPEIIAITGSVGKTSTKETIFAVLKIKFGENIRKSEGNLNNETGVPLAILGYKKSPEKFWQWLPIIVSVPFKGLFLGKSQVLVLEFAADKPGDIKYLTGFAKPKIAVITSIGPAHLEAFGTLQKVFEEKTDLMRALASDGWAVLNLDDWFLNKFSFSGQTKSYGIEKKADCMAQNITTEIDDFKPLTKFQIVSNQIKFYIAVQTLGRSWNVYAALAGACVGLIYEMKPPDIIRGLKHLKTEKHRLEVLRGRNDSIIIDDSYNANPLSMRAALDILKDLPATGGQKIAVLGDMLELGKITASAHDLMGEYAREVSDEVVSVGVLAKGYKADKHFDDAQSASAYLLGKVGIGDIILVKASRRIGLEKIVEQLKA